MRDGRTACYGSPVAEQPDVGSETDVLARNRANALTRACFRLPKVEATTPVSLTMHTPAIEKCSLLRRDRPRVPAPTECDRRRGVARVRVEPVLRVEGLRARDRAVQRRDLVRVPVHDRRAGVDDRVEARAHDDAVRRHAPATDLPVADLGDGVVLDGAGVERGVCAPEEKLGALRRELEAEDARRDAPLGYRGLEERRLEARRW